METLFCVLVLAYIAFSQNEKCLEICVLYLIACFVLDKPIAFWNW